MHVVSANWATVSEKWGMILDPGGEAVVGCLRLDGIDSIVLLEHFPVSWIAADSAPVHVPPLGRHLPLTAEKLIDKIE